MGRAPRHAGGQGLMAEPNAAGETLLDLAASRLAANRPNEALEAAAQSLLAHDSADGRALFVRSMHGADRLPGVPGFRRLLIRALREAWTRPIGLTGAAIAMIKTEPAIAAAARAAMAAWPRRLSQIECGPAIGILAANDLLRAVLDTALVNDAELERLLTSVRAVLLESAVRARSEPSREMLAFACSLA